MRLLYSAHVRISGKRWGQSTASDPTPALYSNSMDQQWPEIISKIGIAGVMVLGVGYGIAKYLWPFLTAQINRSQDRLDAQTDKFADTIRAMTTLMAESQQQNLNALQEITRELRSLHEAVKNGNKK